MRVGLIKLFNGGSEKTETETLGVYGVGAKAAKDFFGNLKKIPHAILAPGSR